MNGNAKKWQNKHHTHNRKYSAITFGMQQS